MPNSPPLDGISTLVFAGAPFGMAIVDSRTNAISQANESYCALVGRGLDEVRGMSWLQLTHPDDRQDDLAAVASALERRSRGATRARRYIRPDGTTVHAQVTIIPFPEGDGKDSYVAIVQDLTPIRRALEERIEDRKCAARTQQSIFRIMAALSEFRDRETGEHILRTRIYVKLLMDSLPFAHPYSRKAILAIADSAMLHDIGKVGIPDSILLKPGSLTDDERRVMETHTILGSRTILRARGLLDDDAAFMFAREISESHHERWDGTGYPHRLSGEEIPLTARVMAIADVYDALISERPYKLAYRHEVAVRIMSEGVGTHFDPALVALFLSLERQFREIARMSRAELQRETDLEAW